MEQADIFALAMLGTEVFTGELPLGDIRHETAVLIIAQGQRPEKPRGAEPHGFTAPTRAGMLTEHDLLPRLLHSTITSSGPWGGRSQNFGSWARTQVSTNFEPKSKSPCTPTRIEWHP